MLIHLFLLISLIGSGQVYSNQYFIFGGQVTINGEESSKATNPDNGALNTTDLDRSKGPNKDTTPAEKYNDLCLNLSPDGKSPVWKTYAANDKEMKKYEAKILDKKTKEIKKDYLVSVVNCAGGNLGACGEDIFKASEVMEYDARLKTSIQLNKEYYKKIEEVRKKATIGGYINDQQEDLFKTSTNGGKAAKDLILARVDMAKAESELMDYYNREKISKFVKAEKSTKTETDFLVNLTKKKDAFNQKIEDLNNADFSDDIPKDSKKTSNYIKGLVQDALNKADADLEVSVDAIKSDEIYSSIPAGLEVCKDYAKKSEEDKKKCEALAGQYNAAASTGGSTWSPVTIYNNKNCSFMDNLGMAPFNSIMDIVGASKSLNLENCMMAKGARGCTSEIASVRNFYNDPMNLTSQFYQDGKGNVGMNIETVDSKINTSLTSQPLAMGGNIPSNLFGAYSPTSNSKDPAATGAGFGGGSGDRFTASNGASFLNNNIAPKVTAAGAGANNFNSQYNSAANNITTFNNNLSGALTSWVDPNIYLKSANSVQKDLDNAKGGSARYTNQNGYDNTIDLRQKISEINAQKATLFQQLVNEVSKGNSDGYYIKYGSLSEKQQAAAHMALSSGYTDYIKMQIAVLDGQAQLYYSNTNRLIYNTTAENTFDVSTMYASNGETVYGKRSLKIKPLKTPITNISYVLKKGWQDEFKKYIANMLKKAEESKKKMNLAKSKMQQLLSKEIPIINLEKLPDTAAVANEIRNMEGLEAVAKKNMIAIEAAMEYHRSKKLETPSDVYAQYEQEAATLKKSMQNVVSSIDQAKPELNRSYAILSKMDIEVPKSDALRRIAKQMIDQGL